MIFLGYLILFRPKNVLGYQCLQGCFNFFVLWSQGYIKFLDISSKTIYIFFTLFFFKILGPFFYLGALGNDLIGLVEGPTPVKILY